MTRRLIPVSELVGYLKGTLEANPILHGVWVQGEVSNFRHPYSGHWYFSLKDEKASLACVMFRYQAAAVGFMPQDGDHVILTGDVTVYEKEGRMQLRCTSMRKAGIGDLYLQLEALKKKLHAEGLFDEAHKKPLPAWPFSFGLVTGNDTAARQDIYRTFHNRWPCAKITDYPAPVQGKEAAPKIIAVLQKADQAGHDVILLVRGGGSMEDLWCFNDEALVRCIYAMQTPVVTGVGHETDTTLVDYVADAHANTPTGAVEIATPDYHAVHDDLEHRKKRMIQAVNNRLNGYRMSYDRLAERPCFLHPERLYEERAMRLDALREKLLQTSRITSQERVRLNRYTEIMRQMMSSEIARTRTVLQQDTSAMRLAVHTRKMESDAALKEKRRTLQTDAANIQNRYTEELKHTIALLDAYSPLKVLARGYSVVSKDAHTVSSIHDVQVNDDIEIQMCDGSVSAQVKTIEGK